MTRITPLAVQIVVTVVLATVLSLAVPVFVDRREYEKAVFNYTIDPNPANNSTLKAESASNLRHELNIRLATAGGLFLVLNGLWVLVSRRSRKPSNHT